MGNCMAIKVATFKGLLKGGICEEYELPYYQ